LTIFDDDSPPEPQPSHAELYRREAMRLYGLADAAMFAEVRHDLVRIARQYELLARRTGTTKHRFVLEPAASYRASYRLIAKPIG
jgi:hypothetical protein